MINMSKAYNYFASRPFSAGCLRQDRGTELALHQLVCFGSGSGLLVLEPNEA